MGTLVEVLVFIGDHPLSFPRLQANATLLPQSQLVVVKLLLDHSNQSIVVQDKYIFQECHFIYTANTTTSSAIEL